MITDKNIQEKIDHYLLGEMLLQEQKDFEKEMIERPALEKEVKDQQRLLEALHLHENRKELKKHLDIVHRKMNRTYIIPKRKTVVWLFRYVAVAACVSFLMTVGVLYFSGWFSYDKKVSASYTELKRDLDHISKSQKSIWQQVLTLQEEDELVHSSTGTGFPISSDGYLITSYHVVKDADSVFVTQARLDTTLKYDAKIVFEDPKKDLAILHVTDSTFTGFGVLPYTFKSDILPLGSYVYTLGYSKKDVVFSEGSISSLTGFDEDTAAYQISVPVNPGNSGGALIDAQGNLIGIISGKDVQKEGAAFAIKSKYVLASITQYMDSTNNKIALPNRNRLRWLKKVNQIQQFEPFVFTVKTYK